MARSGGREVVVHASTVEGMKRAITAGVATIEHGDDGTAEVFNLMKEKGVALCPTLSAGEAIYQYRGWHKGVDAEPERIAAKKRSFAAALKSGVTVCMGGDVGVYTHGDNAREMELMAEYGMQPLAVLKASTSVNATVFGYSDKIGFVKKGLLADLIAVNGNPATNIHDIRNVLFIMKDGVIYKKPE
jgi:imidazolonepropionase-like amidohydrolase